MFSTPRSVTIVLGGPKYGMIVSSSNRETHLLVLSGQAKAKTKPVAASTAVQIATFPSVDVGIDNKSMCNLSPNLKAVGFNRSSGIFV